MRIGLTGGIAAGKSTVAGHLKDLGLLVIDYDDLARQVVAPGGEGLKRIALEFGNGSITAEGQLDRAWMADHVFGEQAAPGARERLDAIEHPLIYEAARRIEQSLECGEREAGDESEREASHMGIHETGAIGEGVKVGGDGFDDEDQGVHEPKMQSIVVHDVPLLSEVIDAMPFSFAHIVSVEAPAETRIARMVGARDMTRVQALARIRHQSSEAERRALADAVIDASQPIERMFEHVDMLVAQWRQELRAAPYS
ncbi:MAG: dephospho-CoA kinase [Bifidobacterium sp.]|nr:dephospho-CoA kinase [Bifidobacterium sp.]MCH4209179.1 dephospho-CoA kinase [Bifidobacterium sp.]MCI1224625.1 dephospho-CoA kinase [Bifidobacterium sp.]